MRTRPGDDNGARGKTWQGLRLRQQLVMTPQLQQAIKILQLSLPELEAVVQSELDSNPMLEPLDQSVAEAAANSETNETSEGGRRARTAATRARDRRCRRTIGESDWEPVTEERSAEMVSTEAPDAAVELRELGAVEKLDWREYLENYSNNWQDGEAADPDDDRRQTLENTLTRKTSLEDHLMWQLRLSNLDELDQRVGATIIYNLNDDGYLETPLEELAAQIGMRRGTSGAGPQALAAA